MLSGMACYRSPSTIHTCGQRRAWKINIALGQHTQSDNVGRGMPSLPLDYVYTKTSLSVAWNHSPRTIYTDERRLAWCAIIALGQYMVGQHRAWHDIIDLRPHIKSNAVRCGMPSWPFESTHGQVTSGVACPLSRWTLHKDGQRQAWHAIMDLGQHTQSDDIRCGNHA